jgi:uncharacterized protein
MNELIEVLQKPWPWYVAGPIIGLTIPLLLIFGNRSFGISSSLRHICAMCFPGKVPFFNYDWRREAWNLFFVCGILLGGILASAFLSSPGPVIVDDSLRNELASYGITNFDHIYPVQIFNFESLLSSRGFVLLVVGGFLVGFGTRYAGGCTSGHSITGISMLQIPSVIATVCFMAGGVFVSNFILPYVLAR